MISFIKKSFLVIASLCQFAVLVQAQSLQTLSLAPDSPRWEFEGQAKPADYQGRKSLLLDGGAAVIKDFELRDGVIDVDVATPARKKSNAASFKRTL